MTASQTLRANSRPRTKVDDAAVPNVGDVTSWPTPESAIADDRGKPPSQDQSESRVNGSKSSKKAWEAFPVAPTFKFDTQLPPAAARRGGRSGRGGLPRGGHSSNAANTSGNDRQGAGNAMPPPPLPRYAADQDRGRNSDVAQVSRSNSLPSSNRRAPSRESTKAMSRKQSGKENQAVPASTPPMAPDTDPTHNQRVSNFSSHTPSRSSSHHDGPGAASVMNGDFATSQVTSDSVADPFTMSNSEASIRPTYLPDRSKGSHATYRSPGDSARERGAPKTRDWPREKSDSAREKVESWRDRDYAGESGYRRESRAEPRRGAYRGRGNHSGSYQNSHAYTSPLPQNGFENPRPANGSESRSRQSSQPFVMGTPTSASRNNPRSQSIPVSMMYPGYYPQMNWAQQGVASLNTDMAYGHPPQMQMQQDVMSAMPYNESLNSYAVYSMVMTQIEYYFSIDNLCKDLYLRKNMDSQGFVPLSVIANFKRIKTLTGPDFSIESLKFVCQQVKSVEYVHGEDGQDKMRRREGWGDFILPMNERFATAQNDGPTIQTQNRHMPMMAPPMMHGEGMSFVPQQVRSPPTAMPTMNGGYNPATSPYAPMPLLDGQAGDQGPQGTFFPQMQDQSRRESATSPVPHVENGIRSPVPFHPTHRTSSGMMNGHRRQVSRNFNDENMFPDEAIASINICVREPLPDLPNEDSPAVPGMTRVLSNESRGSNPDAPRVSGLRGGASSPEQ